MGLSKANGNVSLDTSKVKQLPGNKVIYNGGTTVYTSTNQGYRDQKVALWLNISGKIRVTFDMKSTSSTCYAEADIQVGAQRMSGDIIQNGTTYVKQTVDVNIESGKYLFINLGVAAGNSPGTAYITNVKLSVLEEVTTGP